MTSLIQKRFFGDLTTDMSRLLVDYCLKQLISHQPVLGSAPKIIALQKKS
jgi:hypothetical protein